MSRLKEQRSWDNFSSAINPSKLKVLRIENMAADGTPDVILHNRKGTVIWIENKAIEAWPMRASTLPIAKSFEPGQMPFLREWRQWGGHSYVLLRVAAKHFLLDPTGSYGDPRDLTRQEIEASAVRTGKIEIISMLEQL